MFQGATSLNLDAKGRMAVPARHRDVLSNAGTTESAGRLILTTHPHRCLLLYPEPAWAPIRDQILAAPSFDPRSAAAKRVLVGNAREESMDAAGRLLIAPELRDYAGFEKQVWLVGMGSHFEIWSDAGWKRQHEAAFDALVSHEPPPGFEGISL
ncbi:MAG: division/cell wall cluster transcriptional repressor MraZ [Rhodocyclaceae bacterium]|jgi:MraZ protein|nr:division/cell wall cluster transcriptional repressor MraZ [Rhodocyclaceae bacterium]